MNIVQMMGRGCLLDIKDHILQNIHRIDNPIVPNNFGKRKNNMSGSAATKIRRMHSGIKMYFFKNEMRIDEPIATVVHRMRYWRRPKSGAKMLKITLPRIPETPRSARRIMAIPTNLYNERVGMPCCSAHELDPKFSKNHSVFIISKLPAAMAMSAIMYFIYQKYYRL